MIAPSSPPSEYLDWKFIQSFGDDASSEDDLVTAVEYDETGEYLAVGDKAGRICIFEGKETKKKGPIEYKFCHEFQSHEPEFDCLKSLEIEEKINVIKWGKRNHNGLFLLATNDKTIKYWKVHEKKIKKPVSSTPKSPGSIVIPKLKATQSVLTARPKKVFSNAHGYHINSIAINSDCETFISADDLRINLWNLEISSESFNIVDQKPSNLEELTEVITSATFHPSSCNILMYSSSRGLIRLGDLRDSALCDKHAKQFNSGDYGDSKLFFSEIISSISDAKFTPNGRYIVARDYLSLKVWDINMDSKPLLNIPIHSYLKMHLCDLYENEYIFDKFLCDSNPDGSQFITGSYNNNFVIYNTKTKETLTVEALKDPPKRSKTAKMRGAKEKGEAPDVNLMNFNKKALHTAWHPRQNAVAVAGLNKLYIYQAI